MKIMVYDSMSALRARLERDQEPALMLMRGVVNDALRSDRITIWAWDTYGGNEARRAIFPGYKNRPPSPSPVMAALGMLKELLAFTPAFQISQPGFEGDDLVAAVVEQFRGKGHEIEISTRDGDLSALAHTPDVTCTAKVLHRIKNKPTVTIPPALVPLYKLTVGDKSDTIPGIHAFGPMAWDRCSLPHLSRFLDHMIEHRYPLMDSDETEALTIGLSKATTKWLGTQEGADQLCAMKRIIAPLPMTPEQFNKALTRGVDNPAAREAILRKFMI